MNRKLSGPAADISKVYELPFVEAAAILDLDESATFERLRTKLKSRGVSVSRWSDHVRKAKSRIERERAQAATKPNPGGSESSKKSGQALNLADPEPADHPVDGTALAQDLADTIRRFVRLSDEAVHAILLWIFFTYLVDVFDYAPRLAICSPEMRCGKTTLVELISYLVRRPLPCSNISAAAIYRTIEAVQPTLLMDELDSYLRPGDEAGEEMRGILNSGHSRALAFVIRLAPVGRGDFEPRRFSTFTPIVQALIGKLPTTLADRSIAIEIKRKLAAEKVERLGGKNKKANAELFDSLRRRIARWTNDNRDAVAKADPVVPDFLGDRQANNWSTLLPIADAIGWGELARNAARKLSGATDDVGIGILLLRDIKLIFETKKADKLTSAEICESLHQMESRPWPEFGRGRKPISQPQVASLLRPFGIYPLDLRTGRGTVKKGYRRAELQDAFSRYCEENDDPGRDRATTAGGVGESDDFASATKSSCSGSQNHTNLYAEKGCSGVADENPDFQLLGEKEEF